jgi:hypothetical protein
MLSSFEFSVHWDPTGNIGQIKAINGNNRIPVASKYPSVAVKMAIPF